MINTLETAAAVCLLLALGGSAQADDGDDTEPSSSESVTVVADAFAEDEREPLSAGFPALVEYEARAALADGKLRRAHKLLTRLLEFRSDDLWARRELGRVSAALGLSAEAVRILLRVDKAQGHAPDPELHFIVGGSLFAMGRRDEALAELARADLELTLAEPSLQRTMWLARIYSLRGDWRRAETSYLSVMPTDPSAPEYEGVSLSLAEAYMMAKEWNAAEDRLRTFLSFHSEHERAREMLAWTLESRGKLGEELEVRSGLADQISTAPGRYAASEARALERAHDHGGALEAYRFAAASGVVVDDEIRRMEGYLAPEIGGSAAVFTDPLGDRFRSLAGMSIPVTSRLRVAASGGYETVSDLEIVGFEARQRRLVSGTGSGVYEFGRGTQVAVGAVGWQTGDGPTQLGGQAMLRTSPARRWSVYARADANTPWRESAATVREGGSADQLELQFYTTWLTDRLVLMAGGRVRRLGIEMTEFLPEAHAQQFFGAAGFDVTVSRGNGRVARGQFLDGEFVSHTALSSGLVLSYRHYETRSDNPFGMRLSLVERTSLEDVSATARHVIDEDGVFSVAALAGGGYDRYRDLWRWRAGGLMYVSPSPFSRLGLSVESASETASGITGRNTAAMMELHVDL